MSETKTKNLCTVPAADLTDSQYFIAEDGGELKRIPKAQVVLKKLEKMLATDTENLAGGGEVTAQELLDALAEQVANKLLAKSQVVNNLLATVEGNPLDATQGKALKELIDTTNNNLSKFVTKKNVGGSFTFEAYNSKEYTDGISFSINQDGQYKVNHVSDNKWGKVAVLATKDDLGVFLTASGTKAAVFKGYVEITNLKLYAGHTYLVLGKTGSSISVSLISARVVSPSSEYGSAFNFLESRTTGSNGGGCVTAAIITLTKDYTVPLQGYGYDNATYDYSGFLMAIQLK